MHFYVKWNFNILYSFSIFDILLFFHRNMSALCFVCNLPILSHQVGLVWEGGNGYDDIQSDQSSTLQPRIGRRDSAAQITTIEPPRQNRETSPPVRRRRSSLAQLTDIFRRRDSEHKANFTFTSLGGLGRRESRDLSRRESLVEIAAKSLPWRRESTVDIPKIKTSRRDSTTDLKKRRQSSGTDLKSDIAKFLIHRESVSEILRKRQEAIENEKKERRDSTTQVYTRTKPPEKLSSPERTEVIYTPQPLTSPESREFIRPMCVATQPSSESHVSQTSLVSQVSASGPDYPDLPYGYQEQRSPITSPAPSSPTQCSSRRESLAQAYKGRRDSRPHLSPERPPRLSRDASPKLRALPRQSTAYEDGLPLPDSRRGSRPFLSPDATEIDGISRRFRRDSSLSPDSAAVEGSRPHLSPEASDSNSRETSPRSRLRRQSTTAVDYCGRGRRQSKSPRSPDSSSTCSSRDHSPKDMGLRRQSTTEEILIARGFRRQSTTEDIMRARNFRRQSTQSEEMSRSRGRRDSCAQITDGTIATMTIETTSAFFDTSTQTGNVHEYFYCSYDLFKNY